MKTSDLKQVWTTLTVSAIGLQKAVHENLYLTIQHMFNNRMDTSVLTFALNSLENVEGSFRIQPLIAYSEEFAGVTITPDKEKGHGFIVKKDRERNMTRGKKQLELIKATPWYEWAEPEKALKAPKMPENAITQAAKGYASGEISSEQLIHFANAFVHEVKQKAQQEKIQDFAIKYLEQTLAS